MQSQQSMQLGSECIEDSPGLHQRVDNMHANSGTDFVAPYFPTALAKSREQPLEFNFDMRFLDSLTLPCEIVSRENMELVVDFSSTPEPVKFHTTADAITYSQEKIQDWKADKSTSHRRLSHPDLNKDRLFEEEGRALEHLLMSGIASLDCNLKKVRQDR